MKKTLTAAFLALALVFGVQEARAQMGFGVHGAYDLDLESFGVGGQLRTGVGLGGFALVLNPSAEYYFVDDGDNVSTTLIRVGADLLYQIGSDFTTTFQPYLGAGLGLQFINVDVDGADIDGSDTSFGLNLVGGANFGIGGSIMPFAQAGLFIGDGSSLGIKAGILFGGP